MIEITPGRDRSADWLVATVDDRLVHPPERLGDPVAVGLTLRLREGVREGEPVGQGVVGQQGEVGDAREVDPQGERTDRPGVVEGPPEVREFAGIVSVGGAVEDPTPGAQGVGGLAPRDLVEVLGLDDAAASATTRHEPRRHDETGCQDRDDRPLPHRQVHGPDANGSRRRDGRASRHRRRSR